MEPMEPLYALGILGKSAAGRAFDLLDPDLATPKILDNWRI